jgi:hypothetical protein
MSSCTITQLIDKSLTLLSLIFRLTLGLIGLGFASSILSAATLDDLHFTLINGGTEYSVSAVDVTSIAGEVDIPASYNGKPVTEIAALGFGVSLSATDFPDITSVTIPASIKTIGAEAFQNCRSLSMVTFTLYAQLTTVENFAFSNCKSLRNIHLPESVSTLGIGVFTECTKLTFADLPDSTTSIPNGTFYNCISLSSVVLPDSLTSIGNSAFFGCLALSSIDLPETVTVLKNSVFYSAGLTEITLPSSLRSLGNDVFDSCFNLASVTFLGSAPTFGSDIFLSTDLNVGGLTITIYDTYEESYASLRDQYKEHTFNIVPGSPIDPGLLYVEIYYTPSSQTLSIVTHNEDSAVTLNLEHKATLGEAWATLSTSDYQKDTDTETGAVTRTMSIDPETNSTGFYRLMLVGGTSSN